jgi:GT2 family glycosyltransferase
VALRREDLFRDDGTDALTVCASVPLAYARLALALTDNYGWRYWGLSDDDEALMESGIGALIEAMSRAGRCGMVGQMISDANRYAIARWVYCWLRWAEPIRQKRLSRVLYATLTQ